MTPCFYSTYRTHTNLFHDVYHSETNLMRVRQTQNICDEDTEVKFFEGRRILWLIVLCSLFYA